MLVRSESFPETETHRHRQPASRLPQPGSLTALPVPLGDFGHRGRALICAGDIIEGTFRFGCSLVVAPGEALRTANAADHRSSWRVAVYLSTTAEPLWSQPELVVERSLAWVVRFLCENGEYMARCARPETGADIEATVVASVAWVAHSCRDVITWHIARLRPHVDRQPSASVVAEVGPILRGHVLEAAGVFGQSWVADVMGSWGHLATYGGEPTDAYLLQGHRALQHYLGLRT